MSALRLRELREQNGLTQKELAARLQLTGNAYSLYELGKRQMNYETLRLLADVYTVSIDYLLGHCAVNAIPLSREETDVIHQYRLLDSRGRDAIKANLAFELSHTVKQEYAKKPAM